ncbi:glycosyltransferase family 2 protein [Calothrix sp. PCC 6303]|uniref:glycosyltransferase family 2 protein n=1 Tax=Calothrix sp. PCC 6303 TaxID=1170562 RepID=UPI0002A02C0C|nr:glycosyltransferase family A protein [Calothrix sp. PCC 6303]AFY99667.1 glycosyl transferase family 2 [Calothrix sp. PCC 6303]
MPKVSVVIPAYNAMAYLPQTIDSVLNQTFTDFEILVIDNSSSDNIIEWVSQIKDSRITLITHENRGATNSRNIGILRAKGEYIAFLDADDLWEKTKLEKQVSCLEQNPSVGLVYTWTDLIDSTGKLLKLSIKHQEEGYIWEKVVIQDVVGNGSCAMVRASCFQEVGLFDSNVGIADDFDMWIRIAAVYEFAVVKECLVLYRQHQNNSSKNRQKIIETHAQIIEKSFRDVSLNLLYLRNRAYANLFRYQSWLALEDGNYKEAKLLLKQATLHGHNWCFDRNYIRLFVIIFGWRYFGEKFYLFNKNVSRNIRFIFSRLMLRRTV